MTDTLTITPTVGNHISQACAQAAALADSTGKSVEFDFNDVHMTAAPGESAETLTARWEAEMERRRAEWRASPEYARQEQERRENIRRMQAEVNTLVAQLPAILHDEAALVAWVGPYAEAQDWSGVNGQHARVAELLESVGYRAGEHVHDPAVRSDRAIFARWLIGQVVSGAKGGLVYPGLSRFCRDYADWPLEPTP